MFLGIGNKKSHSIAVKYGVASCLSRSIGETDPVIGSGCFRKKLSGRKTST